MAVPRAHLIAIAAFFCVSSAFGGASTEEAEKKLAEAREAKARLVKSKEEARKGMERLADAGDAEAMYYLGCMYHTGSGGEKNDVLAVRWWKKAAAAGDEMAQKALASAKDAPSEKKDAAKKKEEKACPTATEIAAACVNKYNEESDAEKTALQRAQHVTRHTQWVKENYIGRRVVWKAKIANVYSYNTSKGKRMLAEITTDDGITYTHLYTDLSLENAERFNKGQEIIFGAEIGNIDSSGIPELRGPYTFDLPQTPKEQAPAK